MKLRLQFSGPARQRLQTAAMLCRIATDVHLRRWRHGPLCASWNLAAELGTEILKRQLGAAIGMTDVKKARSYLDSLALHSTALSEVTTSEVNQGAVKGTWVVPHQIDTDMVVLYLHGGGYSFYPKSFYNNLTALIAVAARSKMFVLDYRLTPEYRFPAQIEDAVHCYQWLLNQGVDSRKLIVAGDSAGGNLTLALILSLRDSKLPLPSLAVCLSPATDFEHTPGALGVTANPNCDWITEPMALHWAGWYSSEEQRRDPLVSPVNADLRGLPPIYIQAGGSEILFPGIDLFVKRAREQGAHVALETWPEMNHDFQAFGYDVPQSAEAIKRIGEVIASGILDNREQPTL